MGSSSELSGSSDSDLSVSSIKQGAHSSTKREWSPLSWRLCQNSPPERDCYFHVIYSYAKELKPLLDYVEENLKKYFPRGLICLRCEYLADYETSGYIATYRVDHREIAVAFLVVDLKASRPPLDLGGCFNGPESDSSESATAS